MDTPSFGNTVIVGLQFGDEGKGKFADLLSQDFDATVRYQGGNNAGHTVAVDGEETVFHLLPSAILNEEPHKVILGSGTVIRLSDLVEEANKVNLGDRPHIELMVSPEAKVVTEAHVHLDQASKQGEIGTTGKGIGPTYATWTARDGLLVRDLFDGDIEQRVRSLVSNLNDRIQHEDDSLLDNQTSRLSSFYTDPDQVVRDLKEARDQIEPFVRPVDRYLSNQIDGDDKVLFEGAQGTLLGISEGLYPYVTSSHPTVGGLLASEALPRHAIDDVVGVTKAYITRVGSGPLPTEIEDQDLHQEVREKGGEFGATTGRPRDCGWIDLPLLRYALRVNGVDHIAMTKLDVLSGFDQVKVCQAYRTPEGECQNVFTRDLDPSKCEPIYGSLPGWDEDITDVRSFDDLPSAARYFVRHVEACLDQKLTFLSVGPGRTQTFRR